MAGAVGNDAPRLPITCPKCGQTVRVYENAIENWTVTQEGAFGRKCLEGASAPEKCFSLNSAMAEAIDEYRRRP